MATTTFKNSLGGNFSTDGNWSSNKHPVAGDTANITNTFTGAAYDVDVIDAQAAAIVNLNAANAQLAISVGGVLNVGTINFKAGTLAVLAGGKITGGTTIIEDPGTEFRAFDGTLDGVTWRGTLFLNATTQSSLLNITTGLTVLNNAGDGPGEIDITGQSASMNIESSMTLDGTANKNLVINIGAVGGGIEFLSVGSGDVLTFGSLVSINQTAATSDVRLNDASVLGTIVNNGTMTFNAGTSSVAIINPQDFTNSGSINVIGGVANGESVAIAPFNKFNLTPGGRISVSNFGRVEISGTNTAGNFIVNGVISATGTSTVTLDNNTSGTGLVTLADHSKADILNLSGQIQFLDATGTLALEQPGSFSGFVSGMTAIATGTQDIIDLRFTSATSIAPYVGDALGGTLTVMNGVDVAATIRLFGDYTTTQFGMDTDGNAGTNIFIVPCFAAGTRIATPSGEVAVEDLHLSRPVLTAEGDAVPVVWLGKRQVDCRRHPRPETVWPVRVRAGAFGDGQPRRDLFLSPDHAVFVEDVLIPVRQLINGTSIAQMRVDDVTYFHVELPRHDLLLAEGLPVESYLDCGDRSDFANNPGSVRLFPAFSGPGLDVSDRWEAFGRANLVMTGPKLEAARRRVNSAAAMAPNGAGPLAASA